MARSVTTDQQLQVYFTSLGFLIEGDGALPEQAESWIGRFKENKYKALFHLGFINKEKWFSPPLEYLHHIADLLIKCIARQPDLEISRHLVHVPLPVDNLLNEIPFAIGTEHISVQWIEGLWDALLNVFKEEIREFDGTVSRYFAEQNSNINVVGRVFFHLVENSDDDYPFAFMATYSTKPVKSKRAVHTPLKNALVEFEGDEKKLLNLISTVVKASEKSRFILELLESGELFSPIKLTPDEAYTVLKEIGLYEEAGIMCRVPNWWRKRSNSLGLSIVVGEKGPSKVGLDALLDFTADFKIGDDPLTLAELNAFLSMAEGLVKYKGKWVEISKNKLEALLQAIEKVKKLSEDGSLSVGEAMRLQLKGNELLDLPSDEVGVSITNGQWLKGISKQLVQPSANTEIKIPATFNGNLRSYQRNGYLWLYQMSKLRFGACLADDMGLGKTVQMIAFLEYMRLHYGGKALLVLPASLIGNWQKEINMFAPEMPYQILHKSVLKGEKEIEIAEDSFLYITTYGMASRLEELKNRNWDYLILDEAQAIKNPGTKQTKNIKLIPSKVRFAMTGTPIENRLGDLWSLFDFLNQGLLGSAKEFTNFTTELREYSGGYARLRKMIQPFILRRLKTDKSIISDLPDKVEIESYTSLSKKQTVLYRQLVNQIKEKLENSEGIERKGLVLSAIVKFKQICNHPDQYIGREVYKPSDSGKFELLGEISETIREKHEKMLIFTQFREMTEPISDYLEKIFGKKGYVLHGGTAIKKRSKMVEEFNGENYIPYMVLSLKAGGVGLNLTAANHVVHFDRWWNPAVENQATDRVFRIGQTKNVMVHKFITKDTIEEKIDSILREKRDLSGEILSSAEEHWITEYSNEKLMELFSLDGGRQ